MHDNTDGKTSFVGATRCEASDIISARTLLRHEPENIPTIWEENGTDSSHGVLSDIGEVTMDQ